MNKLSKEKKNQLVLVGIVLVAIIAGLWFSLIRGELDDLRSLKAKKAADQDKLATIADTIKNREQAKKELAAVNSQLAYEERDMPYGDLYLSLLNTIPKFAPNRSDAPENLFARFPYRQVTVSISGSAHYHDLGKFVADFENTFPT